MSVPTLRSKLKYNFFHGPIYCKHYLPFLHLVLVFHVCVEPSQNVTKFITWNRTTSSRSSSSRNPLAAASKEDVDDSGSDFVEEFCMIAGSHSSTLDRLYAWERKLYDEVKVLH
jgi:hypothetical protein